MLRDLAGDATTAEALWRALPTEGTLPRNAPTLAGTPVKILDAQGIVLRPVARLREDIDPFVP